MISKSECRDCSSAQTEALTTAELDRLVAAFQRDPGGEFVSLGHALLAISQPEHALRVGSRGLREVPGSTAGRLMVSRALMALGRFAEAEQQLSWVVSCAPGDAHAAHLLSEVLEHRAREQSAAPSIERPAGSEPRVVDAFDDAPTTPYARAFSPRNGERALEPLARTRSPRGSESPPAWTPRETTNRSDERVWEPAPHQSSDRASEPAPRRRRGKILRFTRSERLLHWSFALPFLVCLSTALLLVFYYNPDPTRPHREIVSWVHRGAGACFLALPLLVLLLSVRSWRVHWENLKEGLVWRWSDFKWLALMPLSMISRRVRLPEEGKFNAGEKLNFTWTVMSYPLYAVTGLAIWFGNGLDVLPWLAHIALAAISAPLIAGHLFMAVINPGSRKGLSGMLSGWVDRRWAQHHYRRWFREKFGRIRTETSCAFIAVRRSLSRVVIALVLLCIAAAGGAAYELWLEPAAGAAADDASRYLAGDSPLWQEATEEAPPVSGGDLTRGEPVILLHAHGEFALVRDARGREGYVFAVDLLADRPALAEEGPPAAPELGSEESPGRAVKDRADRVVSDSRRPGNAD